MGDSDVPYQFIGQVEDNPVVVERWTVVGIFKNVDDRNYSIELIPSVADSKSTICNAHESCSPKKYVRCDERAMRWYAQRIGQIVRLRLTTLENNP